jgi:hypothetical protein
MDSTRAYHVAVWTVTVITVDSLGSEKDIPFLPPFDVPDMVGNARTENELTTIPAGRSL